MNLLFPLEYLDLRNAWNKRVIRRDILGWASFSICLSLPFLLIDKANYFHKDGFLEKIGSFSSVLLGFYVAALIAVATLSSAFADLDKVIKVGVIRRPAPENEIGEDLTRREYVCYMFGYLALVSLFIALISMVVTSIAPLITPFFIHFNGLGYSATLTHRWPRAFLIVLFSIPLGSLAVTTLRGLFYLVERLYAQEATVDQTRIADQKPE